MVGRTAELEGLVRLLAGARAPTVALIGGEAGIGKTRLVQEMLDRLAPGTVVLTGQADPGALGRPFELLLDAVDGRTTTQEHADLLTDVSDQRRPPEERVRSALDLVHRLAGGRPAVLVFDDLHWADSESVALFDRLAEPDGGQLLLVGTYRPDSLSRRHPAAELLPRLERRHNVTHIRLERLTATDVNAFLTVIYGRVPPFRVVEALHARTGGNPFFLEELLSAAGDADIDDLCSQPLPWSLAAAVRAQLDDLDHEARRIVEAASVLGRKIPFDLLATVTRCTEDELITVLRDLVRRGLMLEAESDVFSFRHALAREAIEGELLGRERRRLHQAAFEALRDTGSDDIAAIARHAHGARRVQDLLVAARAGSARSLEVGSSYQALRLAELGLSEADDDLELLSVAARAAWLAGLIEDAQDHTPITGSPSPARSTTWPRCQLRSASSSASVGRPATSKGWMRPPTPCGRRSTASTAVTTRPRAWRSSRRLTCCGAAPTPPSNGPTGRCRWPKNLTCPTCGWRPWPRRARLRSAGPSSMPRAPGCCATWPTRPRRGATTS